MKLLPYKRLTSFGTESAKWGRDLFKENYSIIDIYQYRGDSIYYAWRVYYVNSIAISLRSAGLEFTLDMAKLEADNAAIKLGYEIIADKYASML